MTTGTRKRLTKQELKEDKVATFLVKIYDAFQAHRTNALIGAGVVVVAVAVIGLYRNSARAGASRSEEILTGALYDYEAGRLPEAINGLKQFVERFPRHARFPVAATALGNAQLMSGQPAEAKALFERALREAEKGSQVWVAAKTGLASVAWAQGLTDEAAALYIEAAENADSDEAAAEAMCQAIRIRIQSGQKQAAQDLLTKVKSRFDATRSAQQFPRLEGEIQAMQG